MISAGELPSFAEKKILPTGQAASVRTGGEEVLNARLAFKDERGLPRPFLAQAIPELASGGWRVFPDGKMETTYPLRPSLTWHDGQPLTAADWVFAWRVYATPAFGVSTSGGLRYVDEVAAPDPLTVVFHWKQPYPDAVEDLGILPPLPRHILEKPYQELQPDPFMSLSFWTDEYIGAGPWRLERREPGALFQASAFDGFVFGRPKIDRVQVIYRGDPNVSVATLLSGEAHYVIEGALYGEDGLIIERAWGLTGGTVLYESLNSRGMEIQMRPEFAMPQQLATDVRVRQALAYLLDREAMMEGVTAGKGRLRDVFTHPDADYYDPVARAAPVRYRPDPARAQQLLQEAGFIRRADGTWITPNGDRFTLEQWYLAASNNQRESAILIDGLRRFGIEATSHEFGVQRTSQEDRSKTPGIFGGSVTDPSVYHSRDIARPENRWSGNNRFGYANPALDELIDAYKTTLDRSARIQQMAEMERIANEDLPAIPLYWVPRVIPYGAGLQGVGRKLVPSAGFERNIWGWYWE